MAEALAIIGTLAAGLQLVLTAAQALLATIKLMKDLREIPERLVSLLDDVDDSISRLCHSCSSGSKLFQIMDNPHMDRLSRCATALHPALSDIHNMLMPLFVNKRGRANPARNLWRSFISLKVEKELHYKLQRLNRLNIEVVRELGIVGLETQVATNGLVVASNAASKQGFTNIEAKMDSLHDDFRHLTLSVQRAHRVRDEELSCLTTGINEVDVYRDGRPDRSGVRSSSTSGSSSGRSSGATLGPRGSPEEPRVLQERAKHLLGYLDGSSEVDTMAGLHVLSSGDIPSAKLDSILFSLRTYYTIGNFDSTPVVVRPKLWEDTDLAIYLMKVSEGSQRGASQSQTRGFRLLKRSTAYASDYLSEGTATILIELLSTLSPVNTATCPFVREGMLRYLWELTRELLPPGHPIALVIGTLRNDDADPNITLRALAFIVDRLRATLGPIHALSQLGIYRLCGLLRRSGDFTGALRVAKEGISAIRALLGPGSLQERRLSRQLEHVYMDQCDWIAALSVCFDIVGQQELERRNPDPLYHDECAVMTMEDIAKTCECAGNVEQAIAWLKQATISGSMVWGRTEALSHIHDKLRELLKLAGKEDELHIWTASFEI
jgi:hypothetical protein